MIYQTVGGAGADHANWAAVDAYLRGLGAFADDITVTQTGNTVDNAGMPLSYNLNGKTLLLTVGDDDWHKGDPNSGFVSEVGAGVNVLFNSSSAGTQIAERLSFRRNGAAVNTALFGLKADSNTDTTSIIRDCLFDCAGQGDGLICGQRAFEYTRAYNCKAWGAARYAFNLNVTAGWTFNNAFGRHFYENLTAYDSLYGVYADSSDDGVGGRYDVTFRNCVSCGCSTADWLVPFTISDFSYFYNCADEDGSMAAKAGAANFQTGIVPADNFVSLDSSNSKFLFLPDGQLLGLATANPSKGNAPLLVRFESNAEYQYPDNDLAVTGMAPTYATTDITGGIEYGENGVYSIGCHQAGLEGAE